MWFFLGKFAVQCMERVTVSFLKPLPSSIAAFLFATSLNAQAYFNGVGEYSCHKFLENVGHTDIQVAALSWAQGFVAGINVSAINDHGFYYDVSGVAGNDVLKHIVSFCRFNLGSPLIGASDALLATLPKVPAPDASP